MQGALGELFMKDKNGKLRCTDTEALQRLYEKAFYFTTVDSMSVSDFLKVIISNFDGSLSHTLEHEIAFYLYHYLKDDADRVELAKLEAKIESVFPDSRLNKVKG